LIALEEGVRTRHTGERKPPSKKNVTQSAVDQAREATRLNSILKIENQELRRQIEELQAASQARTEEHLCIIQQALEECGSVNARISNSLYRRIKRHAPSALEELPHVVNRLGDITTPGRNPSSASSLDPCIEPSSSSHISGRMKRGGQTIDESGGSPPKRQCPARSATGILDDLIPTPKRTSHDAETTRSTAVSGINDAPRPQYGSCFEHSTLGQLLSGGSDMHQTQDTTISSTRAFDWETNYVPANHQPEPLSEPQHPPTSPPPGNWESIPRAPRPHKNLTEDPPFYDVDISGCQFPNNTLITHEPGTWVELDGSGWPSIPMHSGDNYNDGFFGNLPTS